MKMKLLPLLLLLILTTTLNAQIFRRGRSRGRGWSRTANGYIQNGRQYIRGVHLPDNPNCPCPMCRDLVAAYYGNQRNARRQVQQTYVPKYTEPVQPAPRVSSGFSQGSRIVDNLPPSNSSITYHSPINSGHVIYNSTNIPPSPRS